MLEEHLKTPAYHYITYPDDKKDQCGLLEKPFGKMTLSDMEQWSFLTINHISIDRSVLKTVVF